MQLRSARGHASRRTARSRALLGSAVALACAICPAVAAAAPAATESVAVEGSAASYLSAPNLHPAEVSVDVSHPGKASGLIFIDPFASSAKPLVGEEGPQILESDGQPVWTHTAGKGEAALDFEAQTYEGKPVLTWWQGEVAVPPRLTNLPEGSPEPGARYYIYNQHYKRIKTVVAKEGFTADLHQFTITPRDTALFIAYKTVPMNLTSYGGSATGSVEDAEIQEVSLKTGKLLFKWDMLEHVPLSESEVAAPASGIWDAYHMNSLQEVSSGKLLVSGRNTWTAYEIEKSTGKTLWQLGGKHSSFTIAPQASFYWQHDVQLHGDEVTMFDDGCCNLAPTGLEAPEQESHGLTIDLNTSTHTATEAHEYVHTPGLHAASQGSVQTQSNGNVLVGWGQLPYYSEYTSAGKLLYSVSLPEADESYRALRFAWKGKPLTKPSVVATRSGARTKLYASWNGATEVKRWAVLSATSRRALQNATSSQVVTRTGFQTTIASSAKGPFFEVQALGGKGRVLETSKPVRVEPKAKKASLRDAAAAAAAFTGASASSQTDTLKSGAVSVKVSCPAGTDAHCAVALTLKAKGVKVGSKTKTLTLGTGSATIAPGKAQEVRVKLSTEAEKALKAAHGKLTAEAVVVSREGHGHSATKTQKITVQEAAKKEEPTSLY